MPRSNIILTGFMATGKTTVGKLLAEQLSYSFVDTDELIVKRNGKPVADIFRERGEDVFRQFECDISLELGEKEGLVISTGGGLMLNPVNAAALARQGQVFCLLATPQEIFRRVSKPSAIKRPLIGTSDPLRRIEELMKLREEAYGRFTQIMTSGKTPAEVAFDIVNIFQPDANL